MSLDHHSHAKLPTYLLLSSASDHGGLKREGPAHPSAAHAQMSSRAFDSFQNLGLDGEDDVSQPSRPFDQSYFRPIGQYWGTSCHRGHIGEDDVSQPSRLEAVLGYVCHRGHRSFHSVAGTCRARHQLTSISPITTQPSFYCDSCEDSEK